MNKSIIRISTIALIISMTACGSPKTEEEEIIAEEMLYIVEQMPDFTGGFEAFYKYVQNDIRYPLEARNSGTEGQVVLEFVVERDGSVSSVKVLSGIGAGCDQEAMRVLKASPNFVPGEQRGRTVRVRMTIPIIFKIDLEATNPDGSKQGMVIVEELKIKPEQLAVDISFENGMWTGKVMTSDGEPLPGANIIVSGSTIGTVSDLDGSFKLEAAETSELVVSFVGYETTTIAK